MFGGEAPKKKEKKDKERLPAPAQAAAPAAAATGGTGEEDGKIHVFSLATGHLYERLLRIMMLSVRVAAPAPARPSPPEPVLTPHPLHPHRPAFCPAQVTKRTSMPVKFWLFENYLSPSFKTIAAAMAQEYRFEVGYVTYKWPEWLTQQTQKQRIIWGYKILFLDVLFPLSVKKVIYVDADQVSTLPSAPILALFLPFSPTSLPPSSSPALPHLSPTPLPLPPSRCCGPTSRSSGRWTSRASPTPTPPSAPRARRRWASSSGAGASGRTTCAAALTTSPRSTSSTCRCVPKYALSRPLSTPSI